MIVRTSISKPLDSGNVCAYLDSLVNRFFKILPMRENGEQSLGVYIRSLQCELIGCQHLIPMFNDSDAYVSLLSILQYLVDTPDCLVSDVKREVFKAISICNKIKQTLTDVINEAEVDEQ